MRVYGCSCSLHGNLPGSVFISYDAMREFKVRKGDTILLTIDEPGRSGDTTTTTSTTNEGSSSVVLVGRVWPMPPCSCPKSLLTSHQPSTTTTTTHPPSILLGTGTITSLSPANPQLQNIRKSSLSPLLATTMTTYTKPLPEAASVVVQVIGKKGMEDLGLSPQGGGTPPVSLLHLLRRVLLGARVAPKGVISLTLDGGQVVDLLVTRTIPTSPGLGLVVVSKSTKVTITRPPPPSPSLDPTGGIVSKPLKLLRDVIQSLVETSCRHGRGQNGPPSSGLVQDGSSSSSNSDSKLGRLGWLVPRGVLLCGPPGVGKTYSVRQTAQALAPIAEVMVTVVNGGEVVSGGGFGEAEKELRAVFKRAEEYVGADKGDQIGKPRCSLIFLDEMDALCVSSPSSLIVTQLGLLLDSLSHGQGDRPPPPILVVGATNRPDDIDRVLRRPGRFDFEVYVSGPSVEERRAILQFFLAQLEGGENLDPSQLQSLAESCVGYVPADLQALVREAHLQGARKGRPLKIEDLMQALEVVGASALRGKGIEVPRVDWSMVGGQEEAKLRLRQCVEWPLKYAATLKRFNVAPSRGILLYGPPGCSKTTLVRAAVFASRVASFLSLSAGDVYSAYVGDAEAAVRRAFALARQAAPCVLFFDEIDAIVGGREAGAESRVLSTFLNELDGVDVAGSDGVLVVAATNQPHVLDPALLRPGRLSQRIYIPPPTSTDRLHILKIHTRRMPLHEDVDLVSLSGDPTEYWTGADLEALAKEAAMSALRQDTDCQQVHHRDFLSALQRMKPSLTPAMLQTYKEAAESLQSGLVPANH